LSQTHYYVIARVEDDEIKNYLGREDRPARLDDPHTLVFKTRAMANRYADLEHHNVLRIHRDYLDVAALP